MENQALSGGVSAILRSGLILENIRRMFFLSIWATGTMNMNFDEKHSPNVLGNQTRLQNSNNLNLFEQIPPDKNRDILKIPTWCGAKNSNKLCALSHLVTWIPHTDVLIFEPLHNKTYNITYVTSKAADQPVHPSSMARVLVHPSFDSPEAVEGTC